MNLRKAFIVYLGVLLVVIAVGCTPDQTSSGNPEVGIAITVDPNLVVDPDPVDPDPVPPDSSQPGYPAPENGDAPAGDYPGPGAEVNTVDVDALIEEVDVPQPDAGLATLGGVLVSKVGEDSFMPITPVSLTLAEFLRGSNGEVIMLAAGDLYKADVRPTGVFIFEGVPAGEYSLVVDLGFTKFPITDDAGEFFQVVLAAGEAKEIGLIEVDVPIE